jgi:hypothetical protein
MVHAAIINAWGAAPIYSTTDLPSPSSSQLLIKVLTSGVHNVVRSRAAGQHFTVAGRNPPHIPGIDGVGVAPPWIPASSRPRPRCSRTTGRRPPGARARRACRSRRRRARTCCFSRLVAGSRCGTGGGASRRPTRSSCPRSTTLLFFFLLFLCVNRAIQDFPIPNPNCRVPELSGFTFFLAFSGVISQLPKYTFPEFPVPNFRDFPNAQSDSIPPKRSCSTFS